MEYPISESTTSSSIFEEFNYLPRETDERGIQIGGISVAIRHSKPRAAIFLTYDEEADSFLLLKFRGKPGLHYTNLRKSIT
jgi:hypothetical protein